MGNELTSRAGRYWILFFQPLPEAGERIAIALVFESGKGRTTIEYDPTFTKVAKVFPDADPQALAFSLESLRADLDSPDEAETILNSYGPQIAASPVRRIAVPISSATIEMLMIRYVFPAEKGRRDRRREDNVANEIEAFVRGSVGSNLKLKREVSAREILGHAVTGTKRIALAIPTGSTWTLIDGVDMNQLTPQAAASRADEVSRTFWNYNRAAGGAGAHVRRVGVVLNGNSHLAPKTHEAHDYALHRFQVDADLAIDGNSTEAGKQLRELLGKIDGR
jgi:hypothetical protein